MMCAAMRCALSAMAGPALRRAALTATLALAACAAVPTLDDFGLGGLDLGEARPSPQFSVTRLNQMWTTAPAAQTVIQRTGAGSGEQIIGLENATSLEGDNFLWLRAHGGGIGGRFDLAGVVERAGGVPAPFRTLDDRNLRTAEDSLGSYVWQEWRSGASTNCVLALRRLESGARSLPRGTRSLEVFLRNCVDGSIEQALAPIRDTQVRLGTATGSRILSPLAAPPQ
ncbi:hypothetical protein [Oceaniglobus trochenteri]|uniref:hypothetical protein n=1 Tax=Oceaniglobus trochenteri TaxID=2763260 RepID=UPI001CFFA2F1|nr:hypothetical protein [Oceaniglobus trochenteri]